MPEIWHPPCGYAFPNYPSPAGAEPKQGPITIERAIDLQQEEVLRLAIACEFHQQTRGAIALVRRIGAASKAINWLHDRWSARA